MEEVKKEIIKEFKQEVKDSISNYLSEYHNDYVKAIETIQKDLEQLGIDKIEIIDPSVAANNKLLEISTLLKNMNIDFYASYNDELNIAYMPVIGDAIIKYMIAKSKTVTKMIVETEVEISNILTRENERIEKETKKRKRLTSKIKSIFKKLPPLEITITDEEKETIKSLINKCNEEVKRITNYTIENNLVNSLVAISEDYNNPFLSENFCIETSKTLQELKMDEQIPVLFKRINEKYDNDFGEVKKHFNTITPKQKYPHPAWNVDSITTVTEEVVKTK